MGRMRGVVERPEGLQHQPDLLDEVEERQVLDLLEPLDLHEVRMRGQVARRTVRHFGFDYDYESWRLTPSEPWPEALEWLRERCAGLAGVEPPALAQVLVARYPPGAGIGWHRDAPAFGPAVVGVSLGSVCVMRLQRGSGDERRVFELPLAPRSAYVLAGPARSAWRHSIPPVDALRWSVTFRTLRRGVAHATAEAGAAAL